MYFQRGRVTCMLRLAMFFSRLKSIRILGCLYQEARVWPPAGRPCIVWTNVVLTRCSDTISLPTAFYRWCLQTRDNVKCIYMWPSWKDLTIVSFLATQVRDTKQESSLSSDGLCEFFLCARLFRSNSTFFRHPTSSSTDIFPNLSVPIRTRRAIFATCLRQIDQA